MTAATTATPTHASTAIGPVPSGHYSPAGVLRSEWTKLRSVRSTVWSLLALAVGTIGLGALFTAVAANRWSTFSRVEQLAFDPTSRSLRGIFLAQLAIGVLGILVVTNEYSTGMIRSTLAAVPNRPLVLAAKAAVFGVVALMVSEVVTFVAFFVGQALLTSPAPHATLGQAGVLRAVVGSGLYLAVLGLFALGIGSLIRHTAGAISTFVGTLLILPLLVQAFPTSVQNSLDKYLPLSIAQSMITVQGAVQKASHDFAPWTGLVVLAIYAAVLLVAAGILFVRRDA
jgi:ABC-type transport system involved in multi-copper enzyme maturation permease subunit